MAFLIEYLRGDKKVGEAAWPTPIPPTRDFARHSLILHQADTAIILDEDGRKLAVVGWKSH
jgi:hypothetical protein